MKTILQFLNQWGSLFFAGFEQTLFAFTVSTAFALIMGACVALLSAFPSRVIRILCRVYVSIFRNSPLLVQLFFLFYGLPFAGVRIPPFWCGVVGITLNEGAFIAEILRGTIQAIDKGQWMAGFSLGLTHFQVLRLIIFPQAIRDAIPSLAGQISIIMKDTSLLSLIMIVELTRVAGIIYNRTFNVAGYFFVAIIYLLIFLIITWLSKFFEYKARVLR